eukprot:1138834-Pelagomonas_calceolata.AAC.2
MSSVGLRGLFHRFMLVQLHLTHHEILHVRTREHVSCGERPPGDVCNERGHVHSGHIISLTNVRVWGRPVIPSCCLIARCVSTESKLSHAANDIMGEVKEH